MKIEPAYLDVISIYAVDRDHITDMISECVEDVSFVDTPSAKIKWLGAYEATTQGMHIVGCIGILPRGSISGWVRGWYVRPEYRGRGIGRLLLTSVEIYARNKLKMSRLWMNTVHEGMVSKIPGWRKTGKTAVRRSIQKLSHEWVKEL